MEASSPAETLIFWCWGILPKVFIFGVAGVVTISCDTVPSLLLSLKQIPSSAEMEASTHSSEERRGVIAVNEPSVPLPSVVGSGVLRTEIRRHVA